MRSLPLFLAPAVAASSSSCGPQPHEVGLGVLLSLPVVFLVAAAASLLVARLWRPLRPAAWPPSHRALGLLLAILCLPALRALDDGRGDELFLPALVLFGTSYAAVALVSLRLFLWTTPSRATLLCHLPPLAVFLPPALLLSVDLLEHGWFAERCADYFATVGLAGWVPGGLFLAILVEIAVRRRLARGRAPTA